jgi:hypothetical protein
MTSQIDLINMGLDQIAARATVSGINPPSPPNSLAAQVASRTYQTQADAIFRSAHWNSARKQSSLTLLKSAIGTPTNPSGLLPQPPIPWQYEYAYPSDCLLVRFVMPAPNWPSTSAPLMSNMGINYVPAVYTAIPFVPAIDTDTNGNEVKVILTNCGPQSAISPPGQLGMPQCVYTGRVNNVDLWDASLQNAVIGALAAWMCSPLTGDDKKKVLAIQTVSALLNAARVSDGNEGITSSDVPTDWMQIRNSGNNFGLWSIPNGGYMGSWASWSGPDGVSY